MTLLRGAVAFLASMLLTVASPVAAQDGGEPASPPLTFTATYNHTLQEIRLQWEPPADGAASSYNLYQNGVLVASMTETNYSIAVDPGSTLANALHVFQITVTAAGVESAPTSLMLLRHGPGDGPLDDYMPPECELVITSFQPNNPPFVFVTVDGACVDAWEWYVEHLIDEVTLFQVNSGGLLQLSDVDGTGA